MDPRIDTQRLELALERKPLNTYEWMSYEPDRPGRYALVGSPRRHTWHIWFVPAWDATHPFHFQERGVDAALDQIRRTFPAFYTHLAEIFPAPVQMVWEVQDDGTLTGVGTLVEGVPRTYTIPAGSTKLDITLAIEHLWPGRRLETITAEQFHEAFITYKSQPGDERTNPLPISEQVICQTLQAPTQAAPSFSSFHYDCKTLTNDQCGAMEGAQGYWQGIDEDTGSKRTLRFLPTDELPFHVRCHECGKRLHHAYTEEDDA